MHGLVATVLLSLALGALIGLVLVWVLDGPGELRYRDLPVVEAPLPPSAAVGGRLARPSWRLGYGSAVPRTAA